MLDDCCFCRYLGSLRCVSGDSSRGGNGAVTSGGGGGAGATALIRGIRSRGVGVGSVSGGSPGGGNPRGGSPRRGNGASDAGTTPTSNGHHHNNHQHLHHHPSTAVRHNRHKLPAAKQCPEHRHHPHQPRLHSLYRSHHRGMIMGQKNSGTMPILSCQTLSLQLSLDYDWTNGTNEQEMDENDKKRRKFAANLVIVFEGTF